MAVSNPLFALNSNLQHRNHLPAPATKDELTMRNLNCVHPCHNDHVQSQVAANAHDRTRARTLELIQKAEVTIRTYSNSSRPSPLASTSSVKRRRRKLRQRRRPPKTSTFHFERRRREKSAGYDADIEFDHQENETLPDGMVPNIGIFLLAAENRREKKKRYFRKSGETRVSSTGSDNDHANQPSTYECQRHLTAGMCSPHLQNNTIDNVSIGTADTVATTMSASSATISTSARQLPFHVGTGPSSPFTLSQKALTMSQAIALSHHAHIIVDAKSPFIVKHVNAAFCRILNTYGVSSDVLGEPLLKSSQVQNDTYPIAEQQGSLQRIILEAKKIVLFPIVSEHGGNSHGWEFHANVHNNFGRAGTSTGTVGVHVGIINHFLIQIVDENLQSNFMQVIA